MNQSSKIYILKAMIYAQFDHSVEAAVIDIKTYTIILANNRNKVIHGSFCQPVRIPSLKSNTQFQIHYLGMIQL
jgi:hypothetical protein